MEPAPSLKSVCTPILNQPSPWRAASLNQARANLPSGAAATVCVVPERSIELENKKPSSPREAEKRGVKIPCGNIQADKYPSVLSAHK